MQAETAAFSDFGWLPPVADAGAPTPKRPMGPKRGDSLGAEARAAAAAKFRGVSKVVRSTKFEARIWEDGNNRRIGYFDTAEEAARAFDSAARTKEAAGKIKGKLKLNFPTAAEVTSGVLEASRAERVQIAFKGIKKNGKGWSAQTQEDGKYMHLGTYATMELAARAFDDARVARGLPRVNFPDA